MHCILEEDVPYAVELVREISNKFWVTDLLCFSLKGLPAPNIFYSLLLLKRGKKSLNEDGLNGVEKTDKGFDYNIET